MIQVVVARPRLAAVKQIIDETRLEVWHELVGGHLEHLRIPFLPGLSSYINEEGKLLGLDPNLRIVWEAPHGTVYEVVHGPIVVFRAEGDAEASLSDDLAIEAMWWLDQARELG